MESVLYTFTWYYGIIAVLLYVILYIIEVKLDLPSWDEGDGPGLSHVKLKRLIERIIQETLRLPAVTDENHITGRNTEESLPFFDPKKYQDLLATAVLNKIIDSYNYEKKFESSTETASAGGANLDTNHNALIGRKEQSASISSSSIEPQSDSSVTDAPANFARSNNLSAINSGPNRFIDLLNSNDAEDPGNLSDYIAQHKVPLPDFSIESDSSNEDIPETNGINKAWEGNWLFKKKKPGSEPSASVGMLVPSPKEDVRTLIGDKTADELSDLSEAGSDYEADCEILYEDPDYDPQNVRIQNKCVIGGKSPVGIFDELLDATSMVSISSIGEGEPIIAETKNNFVLGDDPSRDVGTKDFDMEAINAMVTTNLLKGSPVKSVKKDVKIDDELIAPPNCFIDENKNLKQSTLYITTKNIPEAELTSNGSMSPGSIAEREHKKWYNAVDMPNNPYSPEALKRRLSNASDKPFDIPNINSPLERATSEDGLGNTTTLLDGDVLPDYKRYGRDYYINDAKHACGISKKNLVSSESQLYPTMQQQQQPDDDERDNDNEVTNDIDNNYWDIPKTVRRTASLRSLRSRCSNEDSYLNSFRRRQKFLASSSNNFEIPTKQLAQFEKQLLYHDLKRNSFRARSATKEFVLNPIYDIEYLEVNNNNNNQPESSESVEGDSGIDSFSSYSTNNDQNIENWCNKDDMNKCTKNSIQRSSSLKLRDLASLY